MKLIRGTTLLGIGILLVGCGAFSLPSVYDVLSKDQQATSFVSGGLLLVVLTF